MREGQGDARPGRIQVLGVPVDPLRLEDACRRLLELAAGPGPHLVVTANPELVMQAQADGELRALLQRADLTIADGIGLVWAARLLGTPVPERVAGIDLLQAALGPLAGEGRRLYLLGAQPGVAAEAARRLEERYRGLVIAGWEHGFFSPAQEVAVLEQVRASRADVLLVGLGAPRQERWLGRHLPSLGVHVAMGVGGSLDVLAGRTPRAPRWLQRAGLEWAFRLAREPRRFGRQLALPRFVARVLQERWSGARGRAGER